MNEDRLRILRMLEEKKITADEAERLLEALSGKEAVSRRNRFLKIRVWEGHTEKPKVNVSLPLSLVKWGMNFVPKSARAKIEEKNIDLSALSEALEKDLTGKIVDVDEGEAGNKVEIWIE